MGYPPETARKIDIVILIGNREATEAKKKILSTRERKNKKKEKKRKKK